MYVCYDSQVVQALVTADASVAATDKNGWTAVHWVAKSNFLAVQRCLLYLLLCFNAQ